MCDDSKGLITCMRSINEQCVRQLNGEVDESEIQNIMRYGRSDIDDEYFAIIKAEIEDFVDKVYNSIREFGYNLKTKGIARIDDLPLGKYYLVETKTLDGFVLDDTPIDADLSYIDQNTKVVFAGMDVTNERQKVQITVTKTDSETKNALEGAVFGLFAKEDIVNKDGKVIVKADTQIERGVTGKDGKVTFTSDFHLDSIMSKRLRHQRLCEV